MLNYKLIIRIVVLFLAVNIAYSQQNNFIFDAKVKQQTVKKIVNLLNENYVFPETAKKMSELIKTKLLAGGYESIDDPMKFAETISADLQSISNDKHLRVRFSPEDAQRLLEQEKKGETKKEDIEAEEYEFQHAQDDEEFNMDDDDGGIIFLILIL